MKSRLSIVVVLVIACLTSLWITQLSFGSLSVFPPTTFVIDPAQSKFTAHASRGGLAWFKGHSHNLAVRSFEGRAMLTLDAINPASLEMTVKADSLEETDPVFTDQQKQIINRELDELVLETAKYPEIKFKSTGVTGRLDQGKFAVKITGDLTLHGVTRSIEIPATVTVSGDTMRAVGEFEIDRKDFNVTATNAFHGLVRVKHDIKFAFDIVAKRG